MKMTKEQIFARASAAAFGKPLIMNVLRSVIVEAIVDAALPQGWRWCSADYDGWAGWDFQHADGTRLEVKQSAAKQGYETPPEKPSRSSFDIAPHTGYWTGATWNPSKEPQERYAHIYVLAHHPLTDDAADHRDPWQWVFYILPTSRLPNMKTITLAGVKRLVDAVNLDLLSQKIEDLRIAKAT